jgi:hypothetical protein
MKKPWSRPVALVAFVIACGGEKATEPSPQATPPAALRLVVPDTVTRGQAFSLSVTALDAQGQTNTTWSGTVSISASAGSISPATVSVSRGTATVQATVGQHAGEVTITSTVGSVIGSRPAMVLSGQAAARLEVHPQTFLLPGVGATQSLSVRVFDADGLPTTAAISWVSSRSGVVSVSAAGVASASGSGSSTITARAGTVSSDPALAYVTTPAAGVVLVTDEQIPSGITPVNPQARYGPGWQYRVRMTGAPPQVGEVLASRGEKPIAGRVIGVQGAGAAGTDVTLQLVPLDQVFPNLSINETMPLRLEPVKKSVFQTRTRAPWAAIAEDTLTVGPFKCEYKIDTANNNPFALSGITYDLTPTLQYDFIHNATRKRLVVQGGLTGSLKVTPTVTAALNGSFECKAEVGTIPIPIGGALGVFFGARVPVGLGFAFEGGITLATLGFDIEMSAGTTLSMGYDCNPGCLNGTVFNLTGSVSGNVKPNLPQISSDFRVTAGVSGFAWADLEVGPSDLFPGAEGLQITLIESKAGLKQEFNLSTADVQSADPAYASSYSLAPFFSGGIPGELQQAIDSLLGMVGIGLPPLKYESSGSPLAESPAGSFQIIPSSVMAAGTSLPGDTATFVVDLSRTNYLTQYAVESVKLFRKPSASAALVPAPGSCASMAPTTAAQSLFTCKTDLPVSMAGEQTFYAFVKPILGVALPVLLEVAADAKGTVTVDTTRVVYQNDFSGAAGPAVSAQTIATSPSGERFLGLFQTADVRLSLSNMPEHTKLTVEFDLYLVDTWDGNHPTDGPDVFTGSVLGGPVLKRTTFSLVRQPGYEQAYPGDYPGASNPPGTSASRLNSLGYPANANDPNRFYADAVYRLQFTIPHSGPGVILSFAATGLGTQATDEMWGIDNVRLSVAR